MRLQNLHKFRGKKKKKASFSPVVYWEFFCLFILIAYACKTMKKYNSWKAGKIW